MMNEKLHWSEGVFKTFDNTSLFYRIYRPIAPRRSLIILHGFGEHSHRYEKFAHYLPDFQIAIFDMRGMGQSSGKKVWVDSFSTYEQDAIAFLSFLEQEYPVPVPRILLGHSMGGLTLMLLWIKHQVSAERYVFSAPCFHIAVPELALKLNDWINRFFPDFVYHHPVHYKNLSHDEFEMLSYKNDPWIMSYMTARLLHEMSSAGKFVVQTKTISFNVPVHFLLAGDDKLVRSDVAEKVYANIFAPTKTLITYKKFYHEIFNEINQTTVFKDLIQIIS